MSSEKLQIMRALNVIHDYGGNDGAHHKDWVLDQVVRLLTGDGYEEWVKELKAGCEGPETYPYETGIAP